MEALLKAIASGLVEKPEDIVVTSEEQENGTTVYHLHVAEDDHVLVRRFIKYQCRDSQQGVKPTTGLVHSLGYKVSRKLLLEQFLIFKWVVVLCKWHGS